jgi:Domain of unknown function (DUF6265)
MFVEVIRKYIFILFVIILFIFSGCNNQKQKTEDLSKFNKLSWIENVWKGKQGNANLYESWHKINFRMFEGISYTTNETGNRIFSQNMKIEQDDNRIFYIMKLQEKQQKTFKLISVTNSTAVFENEDYGFPHIINYKLKANDAMSITLSGENEGAQMTTTLNYFKY